MTYLLLRFPVLKKKKKKKRVILHTLKLGLGFVSLPLMQLFGVEYVLH